LLEGVSNFRDFGGHLARHGRRVRRGQLFRSNKLSGLTSSDQERLTGLGIRTIFDLRLEDERQRDPTPWSHPDLTIETFLPRRKRRLVDMALEYPPTGAGALALMHDFYAKMPHTMTHIVSGVFERIAAGGTPCIIHCSAGKDRTGLLAALLLAALEVERDAIISDYVLTQPARDREADMARAAAPTGALCELRRRFPPEAVAVISAAAPNYIQTTFGSIEQRYGSLEGYFRTAVGLSKEVLDSLRDGLLEPA
jgi:protein-tyrosine phosphatase